MKSLFVLLALLPLALFAQPATQESSKNKTTEKSRKAATPKGFLLLGKLEGYPEGTEITLYKNGENTEIGKARMTDGKFSIKGYVEEPVLCFLVIGDEKKPAELYIENSIISVKVKKAQQPVFKVEGSKTHKDFASFVKTFMPLVTELRSAAGTVNIAPPGEEREKLLALYNATQEKVQAAIDQFVKEKPKSVVSAFILNVTYNFNEDIMALERRFSSLDEKVRQSPTGLQLQQFISEEKIGAVGTDALDFSQPDTSGALVSLSSFRGKYVLVDFWASWCGPCRAENPNVVANYKKFNEKNFTILGVSLDRQGYKDKWLEAIKADNLTWTHVSDLQFWNNAAAQLYKVKGIPQNILVDPNGKIVAKNLRGPALEAKLCELLGCETKGF